MDAEQWVFWVRVGLGLWAAGTGVWLVAVSLTQELRRQRARADLEAALERRRRRRGGGVAGAAGTPAGSTGGDAAGSGATAAQFDPATRRLHAIIDLMLAEEMLKRRS